MVMMMRLEMKVVTSRCYDLTTEEFYVCVFYSDRKCLQVASLIPGSVLQV